MTELRRVQIGSGESQVRPAEAAAITQVSVDDPIAGGAFFEFGPPTEAGSEVSPAAHMFMPLSQPTEAEPHTLESQSRAE